MTDLAVIIISYNVRDLLRTCLRSLSRSLSEYGPAARVIVVENASDDGSGQMVRSDFPDVTLLEPGENLGFAGGNNYALRELGFPDGADTPEAVWLLNPDTEVQNDAPARLLQHLRKSPTTGAVGPTLRYGDGSFQHSAFAFPGLVQVLFDLFPVPARLLESRLNGRYPRDWYAGSTPFEVDMLLGAALMMRGEALCDVGLLDEDYFMYVEELDWCRRAKDAGWQIDVVPGATVIHYAGQSTRQFGEEMFRTLWQSRLRYYEKFHSPAYVALVRLLVKAGLVYRRRASAGQNEQ